MLHQLAEQVLAERTTGVPRRMALGALFVLVTIFCVLFRGLTLAGAPPGMVLCVGVLAISLAAGQALLFGGSRPRDASIIVGTCVLPLIVLAVFFNASFSNWRDWEILMRSGPSCLILALLMGPILGYLTGIFLAGGFYLFEHWWIGEHTTGSLTGPAEPAPVDGQVLRWLGARLGRLRARPSLLAWTVFATATLCGLAALPLFDRIPLTYCFLGTFVLAIAAAFMSGIFHLRKRAVLIVVAAYLAGGPLAKAINEHPYINSFYEPAQVTWVVLLLVVGLGLVLLAALGWSHVALRTLVNRNVRADSLAAMICVIGLFSMTLWWATTEVHQINDTPSQRAIQEIREMGAAVGYGFGGLRMDAFQQPPQYLYLRKGDADKVMQTLAGVVDFSSLRYVTLRECQLTDSSLRHFDGLRLVQLDLSGTQISSSAFAGMDFCLRHLNLEDSAIDAETLKDLASISELSRGLAELSLGRTKVTDAGLPFLGQFAALNNLSLAGCQITGAGFGEIKPSTQLRQIDVSHTQLDNAGLAALVAAFPSISSINLRDTRVTDDGLEQVDKWFSLRSLIISQHQFSREKLDWLQHHFEEIDIYEEPQLD